MQDLQSPARERQAETTSAPAHSGSWRDHLKVHPAADLFPMMSEEELADLTKDVKDKGGLIHPVVFCGDELLDGRNRIEAGERSGLLDIECLKDKESRLRSQLGDGIDPYEYVLSANLHRRRLTSAQKRELIDRVLKAKPDASNATIAKQTKTTDKTVAKRRRKLESTSEIPKLEKTTGADGKKRKSRTPRARAEKKPEPVEHRITASPEISIEQRRAENARLDDDQAPDEVDKRVICVMNTIIKHAEGLTDDDTKRFFTDLSDALRMTCLARGIAR
jgi:hypothetical protein